MWTSVVVEAQIRSQGGCAACRAAIRPAVGPFPQQHLNEPLGLGVNAHVGDSLVHDWLLSSAALTPQGLTRDRGGVGHLVECSRTPTVR